MPRRYAVDSSQQSASMSSYPVHRSIPPTQGTVPTLLCFPNIPGLKPDATHQKRGVASHPPKWDQAKKCS
jgi:hypothetical protein